MSVDILRIRRGMDRLDRHARKGQSVEGDHRLYGFLTTEPNFVVAPVHAKAMPVLLTTTEKCDV